jgi:transposase-like protein
MRYSQAEKMDIIRLVETSDLPVKRTLEELDVPRSSFYRWYDRYQESVVCCQILWDRSRAKIQETP